MFIIIIIRVLDLYIHNVCYLNNIKHELIINTTHFEVIKIFNKNNY